MHMRQAAALQIILILLIGLIAGFFMHDSHDSMETDPPSLFVHEWLAVAVIIGVMSMLTILSFSSTSSSQSTQSLGKPHFLTNPFIEVVVEGAISPSPTHLKVKKNISFGGILEQVTLLPEADIRKLKKKSKVRKSQTIKIPFRPMITVTLEGAVDTPKTIRLPKGSFVEDLLQIVSFQEGADIEKLRRKRRLTDGEKIYISSKDEKNRPN